MNKGVQAVAKLGDEQKQRHSSGNRNGLCDMKKTGPTTVMIVLGVGVDKTL